MKLTLQHLSVFSPMGLSLWEIPALVVSAINSVVPTMDSFALWRFRSQNASVLKARHV